jgi:predicted Zn-dependent protease
MRRGYRRLACMLCGLAWLALSVEVGAQGFPDATGDAAGEPAGTPGASGSYIAPGYRPQDRSSDEAGLWSMLDHAERELKTSRFVVRDPGLNAYLHEIVCRLGKDYCADIRIYVVRTPQFNASMAPNGMMEVWTGLLLRCTDEAQLAAILGHEMGHYLRRHSLQLYRDARDKASVGAFLGLGLGAAGLGLAGAFANLALVASTFAFSRSQELEADQIGLELMGKAGYARRAVPEIWEQLIAEVKAGTAERSQSVLFATHPEPEERLIVLREEVERLGGSGDRGAERYRTKLAPVRVMLVQDELTLRQYGRSEVVFDRLLAQSPDDGLLWFGKGEVYRLRGDQGDLARASEAYAKALAGKDAPPEVYRSIVRVELKQGGKDRAQAAFDAYLKARPDAPDAGALRMLLEQ